MRTLLFGMNGRFSLAPLDALLAAGVDVCAVVLPAPAGAPDAVRRAVAPPPAAGIPLVAPAAPSLAGRALARGIPVLELARPAAPEALAAIAALRPDVACAACWPRRIPGALLALPRHGFLNLHPSLLPDFRGPEPLFWVLRAGAPAGVTLHAMDASLDTGEILAQERIDTPDGISGPELEARCAALGGRLLAETLALLARGEAVRRPQPHGGSYQPAPGAQDFEIDITWSARRAFNFMRGTAEWGEPYPVSAGGERLLLLEALAFDEGAAGPALERAGDLVRVRLSPGVLTARAARGA